MIYECKNAIFNIVGVEYMKWKGDTFHISPRNYSALAFRISGTATITVDKKAYYVSENDILYLPQDVAYIAQYSDTEMLVIHFQTAVSDQTPEVYSLAHTQQIYEAFLRARVLWQRKAPGFKAFVQAQLYYILGLLCENETITKMPKHFLQAVSYINENYTDSTISIDRICKYVGISPTSLRLLFQKYYQKTPTEYISNLRLEYARNLISCGISVENTAEQSGFHDSKYFARVVKKHLNCTPRELKLHGK